MPQLAEEANVDAGEEVVQDHAESPGQILESVDAERLQDIEDPKSEAEPQDPGQRPGIARARDEHPGNLVDDDRPGILFADTGFLPTGRPDPDDRHRDRHLEQDEIARLEPPNGEGDGEARGGAWSPGHGAQPSNRRDP